MLFLFWFILLVYPLLSYFVWFVFVVVFFVHSLHFKFSLYLWNLWIFLVFFSSSSLSLSRHFLFVCLHLSVWLRFESVLSAFRLTLSFSMMQGVRCSFVCVNFHLIFNSLFLSFVRAYSIVIRCNRSHSGCCVLCIGLIVQSVQFRSVFFSFFFFFLSCSFIEFNAFDIRMKWSKESRESFFSFPLFLYFICSLLFALFPFLVPIRIDMHVHTMNRIRNNNKKKTQWLLLEWKDEHKKGRNLCFRVLSSHFSASIYLAKFLLFVIVWARFLSRHY